MTATLMIQGALVADAAAVTLHGLRDQERLTKLAKRGALAFRDADPSHFVGVSADAVHAARRPGANSVYGDALRRAVGLLANSGGRIDAAAVRSVFGAEPVSGMLALSIVPALVARPGGATQPEIEAAIAAVSDKPRVAQGAVVLAEALRALCGGLSIPQALHAATMTAPMELAPLLDEALAIPGINSRGAALRFGMEPRVSHGLPTAFHIARRALSFRDGVEENILAGGDSCGRAIVVGALLGMDMKGRAGIPPEWLGRIAPLT
jgi:hypothetical protein